MHIVAGFILALAAAGRAAPASSVKRGSTFVDTVVAAAGWGWSSHGHNHWGHQGQGQCTPTAATLPTDAVATTTPLPQPTTALSHVLLGRGVQNYTCAGVDSSSAPTALGAWAALYDASCIASAPQLSFFLSLLPDFALQQPLSVGSAPNTFLAMQLIGHHYFTDAKSPVFNLDTANGNAGYVAVSKKAAVDAPAGAMKGVNGQGDGAVSWLYLAKNAAATQSEVAIGQSSFGGVYRVYTAGGSPPKTCEGVNGDFQVQYAAEYWFYQ